MTTTETSYTLKGLLLCGYVEIFMNQHMPITLMFRCSMLNRQSIILFFFFLVTLGKAGKIHSV